LLVNFGKTYFSETFPDVWLFLMAGMFLGVVLAFPDGLAGVYTQRVKPWWVKRWAARQKIAKPDGLSGQNA
jgi:urea transport system permease protein